MVGNGALHSLDDEINPLQNLRELFGGTHFQALLLNGPDAAARFTPNSPLPAKMRVQGPKRGEITGTESSNNNSWLPDRNSNSCSQVLENIWTVVGQPRPTWSFVSNLCDTLTGALSRVLRGPAN